MLNFALMHKSVSSEAADHPAMIAYKPSANKEGNWYCLAHLLLHNGRTRCSFEYVIESLRHGAPVNYFQVSKFFVNFLLVRIMRSPDDNLL